MKLIAMFGAGALAAGTLVAAAAPADAQRHSYRGYHGYHGSYRSHYAPRRYYAPRRTYGYRYGYRGRPAFRSAYRSVYGRPYRGYGRHRVTCHWYRGYRRCY